MIREDLDKLSGLSKDQAAEYCNAKGHFDLIFVTEEEVVEETNIPPGVIQLVLNDNKTVVRALSSPKD